MEQDGRNEEALRRRLYRPGASPADLAEYLHAAEAERAGPGPGPPPTTSPSGPSLRPFVVGGVVVAAAALLGAVLLTSAPPAETPTAAARASAAVTTQAPGAERISSALDVASDSGASTHAGGRASPDSLGGYRYVLAPGDTVQAIANRFGLCPADVIQALPYGFDQSRLPEGSILELVRVSRNRC